MLFEEIKNIKITKKKLREFGLLLGVFLGLFASASLWRGKDFYFYLFIASFAFLLSGLFLPVILKPIYKIWMTIALVIGFVVTRIVLGLLFYCIITPIGFFLKLAGQDILELKINEQRESYWIAKEGKQFSRADYEKQF